MKDDPAFQGIMRHKNTWSLVIARSASDEAIQSGTSHLDCFAEPVIGPATSARSRWLAMMALQHQTIKLTA